MSRLQLNATLRTLTRVFALLGATLAASGLEGAARAEPTRVEAEAPPAAAEARREGDLQGLAYGGGGLLLVGLAVGRLLQLRGLRHRLISRAAEWEERLADLEAGIDRLDLDRDALRAQLKAPGQTGALAQEVATELDRAVGEVAAMRAHVARCRAEAETGFTLRVGSLQAALLALESSFDFDTGTLPASMRLHSDGEVLRVAGATLIDSLPGALARLSRQMDRMKAAAGAAHRSTRAELPFERLAVWTDRLAALGLGPAWLRHHHPLGEGEAVEADLEALRRRDPLRWMEELGRAQAAVGLAEGRLQLLIDLLSAISAVRCTLPELPYSVVPPEADPARTLAEAAEVEARLRDTLDRIELEPAVEGAEALSALFRRAREQVQALEAAAAAAPGQLDRLQGLIQRGEATCQDLGRDLEHHRQRHSDLRELEAALREAEAHTLHLGALQAPLQERLGARRHVEAQRIAEEAQQTDRALRAASAQLHRAIGAAEALRQRVLERAERHAAQRAQRETQLRDEGGPATLEGEDTALNGAQDWAAVERALDRREGEWEQQVERARELRIARDQARDRKEAEARARSHRFGHSGHGHHHGGHHGGEHQDHGSVFGLFSSSSTSSDSSSSSDS